MQSYFAHTGKFLKALKSGPFLMIHRLRKSMVEIRGGNGIKSSFYILQCHFKPTVIITCQHELSLLLLYRVTNKSRYKTFQLFPQPVCGFFFIRSPDLKPMEWRNWILRDGSYRVLTLDLDPKLSPSLPI